MPTVRWPGKNTQARSSSPQNTQGYKPITSSPTLEISADVASVYVIAVADVRTEDHVEMIRLATAGHADSVAQTGGFVGGIVLTTASADKVATVTAWDSQQDYLAALHDNDRSACSRRIAALAQRFSIGTFELLAARSACGPETAEFFADPDLHCCVIRGRSKSAEKARMVVNYNLWESDRYTRTLDGFRCSAYFAGHDPCAFAELTQWQSSEHFKAAFADPGFRERMPVNGHYGETDASFHRAVAVSARSSNNVV